MPVRTFFHKMIELDIYAKTISLENRQYELYEKIKNAFPDMREGEESSLFLIASAIASTKDMRFSWKDEVPEEYLEVESFWKLYSSGVEITEWYQYLRDNVPSWLIIDWVNIINNAQKIWKPVFEDTSNKEALEKDPN